jgi:hypothetical protein
MALIITGGLIVVGSIVLIVGLFTVVHDSLSLPDPLDPGRQLTVLADSHAAAAAVRWLSLVLPALGVGIMLAGQAGEGWCRGAAVLAVVAGLLVAALGFAVGTCGFPTAFHATGAGPGTDAVHVFINPGRSYFAYSLSAMAMLPCGIVTALLGIVKAVRLRRASRPALAVE